MDFIQQFLDAMSAAGCAPNGEMIVADDKRHRIRIDGDKGGARTGSYQLRIDGDFAVGWFRNFREGVTHKWSSRASKTFTPDEKAAWKERIDAVMAKRSAEIKETQKQASARAAAIWEKASKTGESEYLKRKGVALNGARLYRGMVVVSVKVGDKLTALQFIAPSGEKRFLSGSELVGGYFSIAKKGDDLTRMTICEGFATGCSVREATGSVVVVAFNAGNLVPVAKALRKKYPDVQITIAADNDAWTKKHDGTPWNPGIDFARQAAVAIGGARVVWPEFEEQHLDARPTDFNDALALYGADAIRKRLTAPEVIGAEYVGGAGDSPFVADVQTPASSDTSPSTPDDMPPAAPLEAYDDILPSIRTLATPSDWQALMLTTEKGNLKASSLRNVILMLKYHPEFKGTFAYNEFHANIMLMRCPPWMREEDFTATRLSDIDTTNTAAELEKYGLTTTPMKALTAIEVVAQEAKFHPARAYFNGLQWDGVSRLATWLTYYLGCENESPEYLAAIGTKWMVAAVKRVFQPGCKFDHILVIEGEQGAGKSTALKELATFGDEAEESYFTDSVTIVDLGNKDTIMKIQGSIIVELSELSGFSKKDDEEVKRWITIQHDVVRLPFGRQTQRFSRQFVLAASTNQTTYLKDPTGNRRYWPALAGKIDIKALKNDRRQLWAEAVHLYRQGLYVGLSYEEEIMATKERDKRLSHDTWTDDVIRVANEMYTQASLSGCGIKIAGIMKEMGMILRDRDDRSSRRIAGILQMAGWVNKPMWNSETGKTERFWVKI